MVDVDGLPGVTAKCEDNPLPNSPERNRSQAAESSNSDRLIRFLASTILLVAAFEVGALR